MRWTENISPSTFKPTSMNSPCSRKWAHFDKRISEWETILKSTKYHCFTLCKPKIAWPYMNHGDITWVMKSHESPELESYNRVEKLPTRKNDSSCLAYKKNYAGENTASDIGCWPQTIFVLGDSWHAIPIFYNIVEAFPNLFLSWLTVSECSVRQDLRLLFIFS